MTPRTIGSSDLHVGAEAPADEVIFDTLVADASTVEDDTDAELDRLIRLASGPSLADLVKQGLKTGAVKPEYQYGK